MTMEFKLTVEEPLIGVLPTVLRVVSDNSDDELWVRKGDGTDAELNWGVYSGEYHRCPTSTWREMGEAIDEARRVLRGRVLAARIQAEAQRVTDEALREEP